MFVNHAFVSALVFGRPFVYREDSSIGSFQRHVPVWVKATKEASSLADIPTWAKKNDMDGDLELPLANLCGLFGADPEQLLSLRTSGGERGVILNEDTEKDDIILRIPLESCIRDDKPPGWYVESHAQARNDDDDNPHNYKPSEWAIRLCASLIDLQINSEEDHDLLSAKKTWFAMMPDPEYLQASLPIHWSDEIIAKAKCTALEIANDSSYFTRAQALSDLAAALQNSEEVQAQIEEKCLDLQSLCSNSWDLVQTRSCRIERIDGIQLCPSLRVLAPIFDFINHGSCQHDGLGSANAYFGLEVNDESNVDSFLTVRARRDINAEEEVLIDYGDSARPAWRCLTSYGFVPNYRVTEPGGDEFNLADESVAELFYNGVRYEVTSDTIPTELVEAAYANYIEEEIGASAFKDVDDPDEEPPNILLPDVALRIAKRISDAAFDLLIDHPEEIDEKEGEKVCNFNAATVGLQLASSLRWSQHQVLLTCAVGLRDYAVRETS